ncbi:hypothetical protein ACP70R_032033 [Stipagrostis hirtigluma subsp. patula]
MAGEKKGMEPPTSSAHLGVVEPAAPAPGEARKAKRRRLVQEWLALTEEAIAAREDEAEREKLSSAAATLRRLAVELDRADADAWAAAHPPKPMPEDKVDRYRRAATLDVEALLPSPGFARRRHLPGALAAAREIGDDSVRGLLEWDATKEIDHARRLLEGVKESAAGLVREYEAHGYIEEQDLAEYGLPPDFVSLLRGAPAGQ